MQTNNAIQRDIIKDISIKDISKDRDDELCESGMIPYRK